MKLQINTDDLEIDADAINRHVSQAILTSALGEALAEIIKREIGSLTDTWSDSKLKRAIETEIQFVVMQEIRTKYADNVREAMRRKLSDAVVDTLVGAAFDAWLEKANDQ